MDGTQLNRTITPREHRLPNGLRLLVREDHSAPVAAIVTHVRAGYFDEPDGLVGVSHVLEHMFFKGTGRRGVGEIARATKRAGGYLNAGTIYDYTSYYTVLPSAELAMGLDIQADALINSVIDADELEKELGVIIQEVNRKLDNPGALAAETLYETLFDQHPMRRWRMGTEEELRGMTRDDVLGYYRKMYRASNIVLVVSGDVDADRVIEHVEGLYADLPPGEPERPERAEPERTGARVREMSGDITHAYLEVGWRSPGALHPDTPALDVLAALLGQGRASRLYRGVRERGHASEIDAYNYTPTEIGVFGISLECEPARMEPALQATWDEVSRLMVDGATAQELERVRTQMTARLLRRLETAEGQANLLARWQALGDWREAGAYLDRVRALTPEAVSDVARRYLAPDRAAILAYRPHGEPALGWADEDVPTRLAAAPGEPAEPVSLEAAAVVTSAVEIGGPEGEDGVVRYSMDGGSLVVKPRARTPMVSMAVFHRGGVLHESPETAGLTGLTMRTSVKGTATRTAERIALESEQLGGSIGTAAGADLLSWSLSVPVANFDEGLALLADVALHPTFPEAEVARERDVLLADLDRLRDDMYSYPLRLLFKAAFPDHPYGYGPDLVESAVREVTADVLRGWHASEMAEPWVFVVGDVEPEGVAEAAGRLFGTASRAYRDGGSAPEWPAVAFPEVVH
ncbi:MAG TPA: insulinase family protein, partial [Longimicrobiales bacterium]|nr:insulinase family protein [Longimicrobiales bacterium]